MNKQPHLYFSVVKLWINNSIFMFILCLWYLLINKFISLSVIKIKKLLSMIYIWINNLSVFTLSMVNINKQLTPLLLLNICLNWVYTQKEGSHFRDIFLPTSYPSPSHIHLFSIYSHYSIFMKEQILNFDIPGSRQTKVIFTNN